MTLTVAVVIVLSQFLTEVHLAAHVRLSENNVGTGFDHATINDDYTWNMSENGPNQELLVEQDGKNTMTAQDEAPRKREARDCEIVNVTEEPLTSTVRAVTSDPVKTTTTMPQTSYSWMVYVPPGGFRPAWSHLYPHVGMHHQYRLPTDFRWPFPPAGYHLQRPVFGPQSYIAGLSHQGVFGYPLGIQSAHGMFGLMGSSEEGRD